MGAAPVGKRARSKVKKGEAWSKKINTFFPIICAFIVHLSYKNMYSFFLDHASLFIFLPLALFRTVKRWCVVTKA